MQNGYCESFNGRMRDELLNEMLFLSLHHARVEIAARVRGYNQERPHSSLGYETPAAFAAELHKQWPVALCPTGSAPKTIASIALLRNKAAQIGRAAVRERVGQYGQIPWVAVTLKKNYREQQRYDRKIHP